MLHKLRRSLERGHRLDDKSKNELEEGFFSDADVRKGWNHALQAAKLCQYNEVVVMSPIMKTHEKTIAEMIGFDIVRDLGTYTCFLQADLHFALACQLTFLTHMQYEWLIDNALLGPKAPNPVHKKCATSCPHNAALASTSSSFGKST